MQIGKRKAEGRKGRGVEGRDKAVIALDMAAGPGRPRLINNSRTGRTRSASMFARGSHPD